ncbi:35588_t:CDS:1, partial [Racocetra persica]
NKFVEQIESNKFTSELIELVEDNEESLENYNVMFDNLIEKTKKAL